MGARAVNFFRCAPAITASAAGNYDLAWVSTSDVARRWVKLYPTGKTDTDKQKIDAILANEALIALYRRRLSDLSWLMKSISEPPVGQVTPISQQNCIRHSLVKPTTARRARINSRHDLR